MLTDAEVFEKVTKYAKFLTKHWIPQSREEVIQEALMHVWCNKHKWDGQPGPMSVVRGLVRSAVMDYARSGATGEEPVRVSRGAWKDWVAERTDRYGIREYRNLSLDHEGHTGLVLRETIPAPEHWAIESIDLAHMWGKLERVLSPSELIVLKYILAGLNHREIGKLMDVTESRISQLFKSMEAKATKLGQGVKVTRDAVNHPKKHKYSTLHWKTRKKLEREAEARRLQVLEDNKAALAEPIPAVVEVPMLVAIEIWWMPTKRRET